MFLKVGVRGLFLPVNQRCSEVDIFLWNQAVLFIFLWNQAVLINQGYAVVFALFCCENYRTPSSKNKANQKVITKYPEIRQQLSCSEAFYNNLGNLRTPHIIKKSCSNAFYDNLGNLRTPHSKNELDYG